MNSKGKYLTMDKGDEHFDQADERAGENLEVNVVEEKEKEISLTEVDNTENEEEEISADADDNDPYGEGIYDENGNVNPEWLEYCEKPDSGCPCRSPHGTFIPTGDPERDNCEC